MNPENPFGGPSPQPHYQHQPHQQHPHHPQDYYAPSMPPHQPMQQHQPQHTQPSLPPSNGIIPTPVVKVLSPFGVEYVFLTIALFIAAISAIGILLLLVNGSSGFAALAVPASSLIVALPVFAGLFLHLKKMELRMPELKLDASKRRSTQVTQIVAFLACMFSLIGFISVAFAGLGGLEEVSVGKAALNALCIIAVSGGILVYYWRDEHIIKR